jgi:hypothetical protein
MVSVSLEPPDAGDLPIPPANTQGATKTLMAAAALVMTMEGVLPPPRLPYAPGPGTYTQLWVAQISTMTREEIKEELRGYLEAWTSSTPDYIAIQNQVAASEDWYVFPTILPDHQVCLIHWLGRYSSGLRRQTAAHNRFFRLLGKKVGDGLPPVVMVPSTGLAPWLRVKDVHRPAPADLQELEDETIKTVLRPSLDDNVEDNATQSIGPKPLLCPLSVGGTFSGTNVPLASPSTHFSIPHG